MATTFKNYLTSNIGVTPTTVVTGGSNQTTVYSLTVANVIASAVPITISVTMVSGATTAYLVKDAPVPVGSSIIIIGAPQKVALENTDIIQVVASAANAADVIVSTVELS
jgi:hypothetical protein